MPKLFQTATNLIEMDDFLAQCVQLRVKPAAYWLGQNVNENDLLNPRMKLHDYETTEIPLNSKTSF